MTNEKITNSLLAEEYEIYTLPSGLRVYIFPKKLTTYYAIFGVNFGSIHTSAPSSTDSANGGLLNFPDGIAHFLEHKLFANENGSDSFERFSELGADANAYTSINKTAYLFSATENFYEALEELITFVTHPYFSKENVASEIGIIAEEIKMYDDSPSDCCYYNMLEGMYEHHPIKRNICGSEKSIKQITPQLLYDCYNAFYNLNNMALFICGDIDSKRVIEIANKLLPKSSAPFVPSSKDDNASESPNVFKPYVEKRMQVSKPMFVVGIKDTAFPKDPNERQKREAIYSILDEMIFSRAGELYSELLEANIISPSFSSGYNVSPSAAYNSIAGEADDPSLVLEKILKYVEKLKKEGLKEKDFVRGKRVMYAEFVKSFDSTESIANNLLSFTFEGCELLSYADILESITFEDVKNLFATAFDREKITLSVILPLENQGGEK